MATASSERPGSADPVSVFVRAPMDLNPTRLVSVNRCTHSDVMATTNTASPFVPPKKRRLVELKSIQNFQPKFRPQLSVPSRRKQKILVQERDEFIFRLERERREREELEAWAAVKVQVLDFCVFLQA